MSLRVESVGFPPQRAAALSDETRTSYLLQGVESAWDSVGRRKPRNQGSAAAAAASSSGGFIQQEEQEAEGGEDLRGAEAMLDLPPKGSNVSFVMIIGIIISL